MKLRIILVMAGLALLTCFARGAQAQGIAWGNSYPAAQIRAESERKPIMVFFFTTWCGYCKKYDSTVFTDHQVISLLQSFVSVRLNAEAEGAADFKKLQATSIPDILFLTPKGEIITRRDGYPRAENPAASFAETLREVLAQNRNAVPNVPSVTPAAGAPTDTAGTPSLEVQLYQSNALRIALANPRPRQFRGKVLPPSPLNDLMVMSNGLIVVRADARRPKPAKRAAKNRSARRPADRGFAALPVTAY